VTPPVYEHGPVRVRLLDRRQVGAADVLGELDPPGFFVAESSDLGRDELPTEGHRGAPPPLAVHDQVAAVDRSDKDRHRQPVRGDGRSKLVQRSGIDVPTGLVGIRVHEIDRHGVT